jgi:hypothetical protein
MTTTFSSITLERGEEFVFHSGKCDTDLFRHDRNIEKIISYQKIQGIREWKMNVLIEIAILPRFDLENSRLAYAKYK